MDDWRIRVILGAVAAVIVGAIVWGFIAPDDEDEPSDKRVIAASACQDWIRSQVDPLDVDFRDPARAEVFQDGDEYRVTDRANVEGDLVKYECRTTRRPNGDWKLDNLRVLD